MSDKIDPARLANVSVYLLERNNEVATGLRTMMRGVGLNGVKTFGTPAELEKELASVLADVLILSESPGSNIFEVTKRIRHAAVGKNPFTVILLLLAGNNPESITAALKSGADSALVKPVASTQLVERVSQLAFSRAPFIATTDYIGPERRSASRPSDIPLIQTINTLRYKMERKTISAEALEKAIASTTTQLWVGKLKSHELKLQFACNIIFEFLRSQRPQSDLKASLLEVVSVLAEAAATAEKTGKIDMVRTCHALAAEIKGLTEGANDLDEHRLRMISLIPAAFEQARLKLMPQQAAAQ